MDRKTVLILTLLLGMPFKLVSSDINSMDKKFKLASEDIERLVPDIGFAFATDMITVEGKKVDYMVREEPELEGDSGWVFYGGGETQEYLDVPNNTSLLSVNTIANYDPEIIGFLTYPPGTEIERNSSGELYVINRNIPEPKVVFFHPVDKGVVQVTKKWSFKVSERMLRRFDNGSLVIWKPGFTIWLNAYSSAASDTQDRIAEILSNAAKDKRDVKVIEKNGIQMLRYSLTELENEESQESVYIFGISGNHEVAISIYFDELVQLVEINKIWESLSYVNN